MTKASRLAGSVVVATAVFVYGLVFQSFRAVETNAEAGSVDDLTKRAGTLKIIPLYGRDELEKISPEDLNQCAGTVQHYRLPPTGYVPPREDSASTAGKALYQKHNCASCHAIEGKGGLLGPPLDGIGGHRGKQFLEARLLDPAAQMREFPDLFAGRPNIMPHPGVSRREAAQLAQYLLTLPEPAGGFLIVSHPPFEGASPSVENKSENSTERTPNVDRGRELFVLRGCAMCHHVEGLGGNFGPRLDGIRMKTDRQSLERLLRAEDQSSPMKLKPPGLPPEQASSIVDFLLSLPAPAESQRP